MSIDVERQGFYRKGMVVVGDFKLDPHTYTGSVVEGERTNSLHQLHKVARWPVFR